MEQSEDISVSDSSFKLQPSSLPLMPLPQVDVTTRQGVMSDLPFIDGLQKKNHKQVGFFPTKAIEGKINAGQVIVAVATDKDEGGRVKDEGNAGGAAVFSDSSLNLQTSSLPLVGYLIGQDQYFKRDDVGIIYQVNVVPGKQRGLIGASLLKAQFERSAYGCKLYCCWCAQDIAANKFWEAMGFVPLAFRAGSEKKSRVHIFWQKRIRSDDVTTPWWFPSKTTGGSIREDRIVLPIPPRMHWSDAKPLVLPDVPVEAKALAKKEHGRGACATKTAVETPAPIRRNGLMFDIPKQGEPLPEDKPVKQSKPKIEKAKRVCDPRLVGAARELRDRWLEEVNAGRFLPVRGGKYDVCKQIETKAVEPIAEKTLLRQLAA